MKADSTIAIGADKKNTTGKFEQFLIDHNLEEETTAIILRHVNCSSNPPSGVSYNHTYKTWLKLCEQNGIDIVNGYPFSNSCGGRPSFRRYTKKILSSDAAGKTSIDKRESVSGGVSAAEILAFTQKYFHRKGPNDES